MAKVLILSVLCICILICCSESTSINNKSANATNNKTATNTIAGEPELKQLRTYIEAKNYYKADSLKNKIANFHPSRDVQVEALKMWAIFHLEHPDEISEATKEQREAERVANQIKEDEDVRATLNALSMIFEKGFPQYEMMTEVQYYDMWANDIKKGLESTNKINKEIAKQLDKKLITRKNERFPLLRKQFVNEADKRLWEHNINVVMSGKRNEIITFIGGTFANNANIKETQLAMQEKLTALGFKRANYKWYKYDDEFTYYTLK